MARVVRDLWCKGSREAFIFFTMREFQFGAQTQPMQYESLAAFTIRGCNVGTYRMEEAITEMHHSESSDTTAVVRNH